MLVLASEAVDDDEVLVDRLRSGDEGAFVELVGRYQPRLLRLAETTVGRNAVAQEVTQDTWLAVVAWRRSVRGPIILQDLAFPDLDEPRSFGALPGAARRHVPTTRSTNGSTRRVHGRTRRSHGRTGSTIACWRPSWPNGSRRCFRNFRRRNDRYSCCAMSRACRLVKSLRCSASATAISECCCIVAAPGCAICSRTRWSDHERALVASSPVAGVSRGRRVDG